MVHALRCKRLFVGCALIFCLGFAATGRAADVKDTLAVLLFPTAADWLEISSLPSPSVSFFADVVPQMRRTLRRVTEARGYESKDCSITERVFEDHAPFRIVDVNGDGLDDILYSGSFQCAEGCLNIIWIADGQGGYAMQGDRLESQCIVRVKPAPGGPLKLTYSPGCCGNCIDSYAQDAPGEADRFAESFAFLKGIEPGRKPLRERVVFGEWAELRSSPEEDNVYEPDVSAGLGYITVGNILTIVESYDRRNPCRGTLAAYTQNREWALAVLDETCRENRVFSYSPGDFLRAGWVRAEAFTPEP